MNMDYFDAKKTRDNLVNWIKDWFDKNGKQAKLFWEFLEARIAPLLLVFV